MTAPLAARRRHLTLVAVTVTLSTLYLLASKLTPTVAGYAGVAWALYLVGARASRRVSAAFGAVFLLNGVAPLGGSDAGLESAILLVVAVAALALGSTRTLTSERTRRWPSRRRWASAPASPASCTTWSPTTSR